MSEDGADLGDDAGEEVQEQDVVPAVGASAAGVLRFSEERDPAALTAFVRLRVIDPEGAYWRRGIEAATRWLRETGESELRVPFTYVTREDWGAGIGGHPLGIWVADQRRYYREGTLDAKRVTELENLGMVWSVHASAWETGLDVARDYAAVHGHFLPPTTAVWGGDGFPIGVWAKNMRASARRSRENAVRRANGENGHLQRRGAVREPYGGPRGDRPRVGPGGVGRRVAAVLSARPCPCTGRGCASGPTG
ncbi:hypothetical protein M2160_000018 [Streptomyces sp. SAI-117]|uniref:helicase associated domain-containing protein n=1 Tax=Streptomyces sp. SAI-117 TaxID=2940546 RepID=UPI0024730D93|nr:helicase associated domain-containing protein [Streptomyces sp. SAI-117]MDH6564997.1 hypothetical protein [Streptomyces sp. SAI-117]